MKKLIENHKTLLIFLGVAFVLVTLVLYMLISIQDSGKSDTVYFVSKTSSENSTFWHSVERGVRVAGDELGVDIVFVGPEREIDLDEQIQYVKDGIQAKPMAIILAASDYKALSHVSKDVIKANITFLTVDSDVDIEDKHSFIATDNRLAAKELGQKLGKLINEKGQVAMVAHLEGTTSARDRIEGFVEGIGIYKNISIIEEIPYSNNDAEIAYRETLKLIQKYPDIKGIFGTNEATLIGIAKAVDQLNLKDQIVVVGFDISKSAAGYLENDVINTIVIQRPFNMGYLSVMEAYDQAKYKKESEFIPVDVVMVTKDNMFNEEMQNFLMPFLE